MVSGTDVEVLLCMTHDSGDTCSKIVLACFFHFNHDEFCKVLHTSRKNVFFRTSRKLIMNFELSWLETDLTRLYVLINYIFLQVFYYYYYYYFNWSMFLPFVGEIFWISVFYSLINTLLICIIFVLFFINIIAVI